MMDKATIRERKESDSPQPNNLREEWQRISNRPSSSPSNLNSPETRLSQLRKLEKRPRQKLSKESISLPVGEDLNEWLAVKTVEVFTDANKIVQNIQVVCTSESCPKMNAGKCYEYLWADGKKVVKPIAVSAPEYLSYLMSWVQGIIDDENIFPSQIEKPFPPGILKYSNQ